MDITVEQYEALIAQATMLVAGRPHIEALDVVHDALIKEDCPSGEEIRRSFFALLRRDRVMVEFKDWHKNGHPVQKASKPVRLRYCRGHQDEIPIPAFTYLSKGLLQNYCDQCILQHAREYYKANLVNMRTKDRARYTNRREEVLERVKAWYAEHREERLAYIKSWRKANPEKVKAHAKTYRSKTKKKKNARQRKWRKANPDKVKEANAKRYIKKGTT